MLDDYVVNYIKFIILDNQIRYGKRFYKGFGI